MRTSPEAPRIATNAISDNPWMLTGDASLDAIDDACDETALRDAVRDSAAAAATGFRHTPVLELSARWSRMQRHAVAAAVRLVPGTAELPWAWFVSGSVARGEAAPGSDVESMLVIEDDVGDDEKAALLECAAVAHALLERCGIDGDANGVLASRSRFCRRMRSWSEGAARWTQDPRQDRGVVMAGLMFDSVGVLSNLDTTPNILRTLTVGAVGNSEWAGRALLQDATSLRAHVPSRLRAFTGQSDAADVKLAAIDPVVKIARWAALVARSEATSTPARIAAGAAAGVLEADDASTLTEAFSWLTRFRWGRRLDALAGGQPASDVVSMSALAPQDRAALRNVAREISGISRKLAYLSTFR